MKTITLALALLPLAALAVTYVDADGRAAPMTLTWSETYPNEEWNEDMTACVTNGYTTIQRTEFMPSADKYALAGYLPRPAVKTYDVSAVIFGLVQIGKWDAVKAFLAERGLLEAFVAAGTLRADFEGFGAMVEAASSAAGLSSVQAKTILSSAECRF